jgi:tRNA (guanine37-N1)-methyltransferase
MWKANILTFFPEIFPGPLALSVTGRALKEDICSIDTHQIRDYALDKHLSVDDTPYGGGGGMVMRADVLGRAIDKCFVKNNLPIVYLSPRGETFNQQMALDFASLAGLNIICGRFEGIDERVFLEYSIREVSLGDYVLSSGDIAAISLLDACIRLLPGVLEEGEALKEESFGLSEEYNYLLEYPHYTRPYEWKGHKVPEILISGHHKKIKEWRLEQAKQKTKVVRPDLLDRYSKDKGEKK